MTEKEWITCNDSHQMLNYLLTRKPSARKLRLFSVACARSVSEYLPSRTNEAVIIGERLAEGFLSDQMHDKILQNANDIAAAVLSRDAANAAGVTITLAMAYKGLGLRGHNMESHESRDSYIRVLGDESTKQTVLLRDIFGNPFNPVAIDKDWISTKAITIAKQIYRTQKFKELPILADILEGNGCAVDSIINHCRKEKTHVRGCWVVDLVLRKN